MVVVPLTEYSTLMKKTIFITGTSTGIGRATVRHFSDKGWQVAATMRHPEKETELQNWPGVKVYALDVTRPATVEQAIQAAITDAGSIDVICNNAGYGAIGIFEKATDEQIRKQFDTNVFGCMNVIRAILPHFRSRQKGIIINITSMGGQLTFPIYSLYHSTKFAMEGFSESLAFELRPLGITVKCIEPGAIKTDFYSRSQELFHNDNIPGYENYEQAVYKNTQSAATHASAPEAVAATIFRAATDGRRKLRYTTDMQGALLLAVKRLLPDAWFCGLVRLVTEKGFKKL